MYKLLIKDYKLRKKYKNLEIKKLILKSLYYNYNNIDFLIKFQIQFKLNKFSKKISICKIKNRCLLTGRARSNYSIVKLSRIRFKELAFMGKLVGIKKVSW